KENRDHPFRSLSRKKCASGEIFYLENPPSYTDGLRSPVAVSHSKLPRIPAASWLIPAKSLRSPRVKPYGNSQVWGLRELLRLPRI
ncbi:MAG: hypothetical protein AB1634_18150, partial [Thermodesulfobacteriota bacterium]